MEISTAVHAKAQRLVDQGKVIHHSGTRYVVHGDYDTYTVHLSYPQEASGACECPSTAPVCSHILAASILYLADPPSLAAVSATDPFEGII